MTTRGHDDGTPHPDAEAAPSSDDGVPHPDAEAVPSSGDGAQLQDADAAPHPDIDEAALAAYLAAELGVEVTGTRLLSDKRNLMLVVSTAEAADAYLLRRPNDRRRADLFLHPRDEYGLLERLEDTSIPTPTPVVYGDDDAVAGGQFLVTTYLEGETVPLGGSLPARFRTATKRGRVADRLVDTLAAVHAVPVEPFETVCGRVTLREQVRRAAERLEAATRVTGRDHPTLWAVGDWLRDHVPSTQRTTLVHGDYRPSNVLLAPGDEPAVAGVLDWETATLGDPLTDLGYLLLRWRDDGDPSPALDDLEADLADADALRQVRALDERGLSPFTAEPGSPTRRAVVARYEARTGASFEHERFYRALAAFGLATVWAALDRRQVAVGGEADRGPLIDYVARLADVIARGAFPL